MKLQSPPEILTVLNGFDSRSDAFEIMDVSGALEGIVKSHPSLKENRATWAERAAFDFDTHDAPDGGPWRTYFQPTWTYASGACIPNLADADSEILDYWMRRAKTVRHPVLVARYADLVWDTTEFVTKKKPGGDKFEFVTLAIDSYVAASVLDTGDAWGDTSVNLTRALGLAMSISDSERIRKVVMATIDYVERTANDDHIGTYCYLFDNLLPAKKQPQLSDEQEKEIVALFETKFAAMTTPGSQWDVDPHSPEAIGSRLVEYYRRKNEPTEQSRINHLMAQAFERRARIGEALLGLMFLRTAREYYIRAGLRQEAERVQLDAQKLGPDAEKQMGTISAKQEIPQAEVDEYLNAMMEGGLERSLRRFAVRFIPDQDDIKRHAEERAKSSIAEMILGAPVKLGHGHIEADVGNETGDPDGKMIHETTQYIQYESPWISMVLERMLKEGLGTAHILDLVGRCELFASRLPLVQRAIEAHFKADYVQSVHVLIPQIERAIVNLLPLSEKPSNKIHRTGKGVMQFKNLNDVLAKSEWPMKDKMGENLRMYLLAVLAHPKGLNIRNDVCHGLWSEVNFISSVSERILHVVLTLSLIQLSETNTASD